MALRDLFDYIMTQAAMAEKEEKSVAIGAAAADAAVPSNIDKANV